MHSSPCLHHIYMNWYPYWLSILVTLSALKETNLLLATTLSILFKSCLHIQSNTISQLAPSNQWCMGLLRTFNWINNFCKVLFFVMGWPWLSKWKIKANWTRFFSCQSKLHHEWLVATLFKDLWQNTNSYWQHECYFSRNNVFLSSPMASLPKSCNDLHDSIDNLVWEQ
jgi:hypothetical protein